MYSILSSMLSALQNVLNLLFNAIGSPKCIESFLKCNYNWLNLLFNAIGSPECIESTLQCYWLFQMYWIFYLMLLALRNVLNVFSTAMGHFCNGCRVRYLTWSSPPRPGWDRSRGQSALSNRQAKLKGQDQKIWERDRKNSKKKK